MVPEESFNKLQEVFVPYMRGYAHLFLLWRNFVLDLSEWAQGWLAICSAAVACTQARSRASAAT